MEYIEMPQGISIFLALLMELEYMPVLETGFCEFESRMGHLADIAELE